MAIEALRGGRWKTEGYWALEVDVKGYFDTINHKHLRGYLDLRVKDGVIRRAIDKWLKAGVMDEEQVTYTDVGTPRGGVVSPLISNIFLHHVLDKWFAEMVQPRLFGISELVRFADDFVILFSREDDARRVLEVLFKRFSKCGLELHPEKTRLVKMVPPKLGVEKKPDEKRSTLNFLGFTLYWGQRRTGQALMMLKTGKERLARSLKKISVWCKANMHRRIVDQAKDLAKKVEGHYQYFGVTFNYKAIRAYHSEVKRIWKYWLGRRSGKDYLSWKSFNQKTARHPLPYPEIKHVLVTSW